MILMINYRGSAKRAIQRDRSNVREMRRRELKRAERNCAALRCANTRRGGTEVGTIRQHVPPRYRTENHGQIKHGEPVAVYGESKRFLAPWRRVPVHKGDFQTAERICAIVN